MSRPVPALELVRIRSELLRRSRVDHHGFVQGVHGMKTMIKTGTAVAACTALLGAAASAGAAEYATVISATPVSGSVAAPRRDCVQGEQIVQQSPSGAGALVGAIAGGV